MLCGCQRKDLTSCVIIINFQLEVFGKNLIWFLIKNQAHESYLASLELSYDIIDRNSFVSLSYCSNRWQALKPCNRYRYNFHYFLRKCYNCFKFGTIVYENQTLSVKLWLCLISLPRVLLKIKCKFDSFSDFLFWLLEVYTHISTIYIWSFNLVKTIYKVC